MKIVTIAEIEQQLTNIKDESDPFFIKIQQDERKGVQQLIHRWQKKMEQERQLKEKFVEMKGYELKWRTQGYKYIAGVDEVGRGPLAGPVVAAAVILPEDFYLPGIDDSKKISEKKRNEYDEIIRREALAVSVAKIDAAEIDRVNIYEATKKAMLAAIASLSPQPEVLLIDAMKLETPFMVDSIIKGDAKSVSIAAASIVAKVARDRLMVELSTQFPEYGFQQNMGYGTKEHIHAIQSHGITPYHRKSFAPVKEWVMDK
ncbi:ribonuclease HII [Neobacillus niacini]|uniref:ribonuclease HII n=2 Tax=Neobacillus niacini TaxID=86668 RepID=UPI00052FB3D3|nr:ribonuclease HII [Neobacillus niacini]KGM45328.1 ribonuclease H [Neobacillus niacini]MEC1520873.1 ribonuclease HII [Neobacillus niacini]